MDGKTPQQNCEEFRQVIQRLEGASLGSSAPNVAASERNVAVAYDPFNGNASVTKYREVPQLLEGSPAQLDNVQKWTEFMVRSDRVLQAGKELRVFLYTFRGLSATLPVGPNSSVDLDRDASQEERDAAADARRAATRAAKTVKERNFAILEPYMCRLRDLQEFNTELGEVLHMFLANYTVFMTENKREVVPSQIKERAVQLVDVLVQLDNLKDMKASILNDFSLFKRCLKGIEDDADPVKVEEYNGMVKKLSLFLADPSNPKSIMFHKTRQKVQSVQDYDLPLVTLCEFCRKRLKHDLYLTSEEMHMYLRVIPHLFLLIDEHQTENQKMSGSAAVNIFKHKKLNTSDYKLICKEYPVVPLFRDMSVNLIEILKRCFHFPPGSEHKWACDQDSYGRDVMPSEYNLTQHWARTREHNDNFVATWLNFMKILRVKKDQDATPEKIALAPLTAEADSITVGQRLSELVLRGMRLLSVWSTRIKNHITWKYTHPQDGARTAPDERDRYQAYCDAVKNNLDPVELTVLADSIVVVKSLAALMQREEATVVAVLSATMYTDIQGFSQVMLRAPLYFAHSKKRAQTLALLEALRDTMADWRDGTKPPNQIKYLDPKTSSAGNLLRRVVAPTETQLFVYRSLLDHLVDENSEAMNSGGVFTARDISKSTEQAALAHAERAFYYPYILGFSRVLDNFKDMGDLLFREYYLEVTRCVQFPLRLSLPWILVDHILSRKSHVTTMDDLLMVLDIYNDAGARTLYTMRKQFMFNEIEAEVQIVFGELVLRLANDAYAYHKDRASYDALPKAQKAILAKKGKTAVPTVLHHFEAMIPQRNLELLGRSVDINGILSKKIQGYVVQDLKGIVERFDVSRLTEVVEIDVLLQILRATHANLVAAGLQLDDFQDIYNRNVQRLGSFSFLDSVVLRVQEAMFSDLTVWFAFNETSQQFVQTDEDAAEASEFQWAAKKPRAKQPFFLFGAGPLNPSDPENRLTRQFAKAHERWLRPFTGYFGAEHCRAIINIVGIAQLPIVIRSCEQRLTECIDETLYDFVDMLGNKPDGGGEDGSGEKVKGFPIWQLPQTDTTVVVSSDFNFMRIETNALAVLKRWSELNLIVVMQTFREVGNIIALLRLIQRQLDAEELHMYMLSAPFLQRPAGAEPATAIEGALDVAADDTILEHACDDVLKQFKAAAPGKMGAHIGYLGRLCENAVSAYAPLDQNALILRPILDGLSELLATDDYDHWHGNVVGNPQATMAMDPRPQRQFHRIWAMMSFLYCMEPLPEMQMDMPSFNSKFGDGFLWGGLTILHLLGQRRRFDILNLSKFLLDLKEFEDGCQDPARVRKDGTQIFTTIGGREATPAPDAGPIRGFYARSRALLHTTEHILDSLEADVPPPPGAAGVRFHPDGSIIAADGKKVAPQARRASVAAVPAGFKPKGSSPVAAKAPSPKPPPAPKAAPAPAPRPAVPKAPKPMSVADPKPPPQPKPPPAPKSHAPPPPKTHAPPVPKQAHAPPPPKTHAPPVPKQPAPPKPAAPKPAKPPSPPKPAVGPPAHAPPPPKPKSKAPSAKKEVYRVAKHKYKAVDEDELSFKKGDEIKILGPAEDEGWLHGELNGKRGLLPDNYLRPPK